MDKTKTYMGFLFKSKNTPTISLFYCTRDSLIVTEILPMLHTLVVSFSARDFTLLVFIHFTQEENGNPCRIIWWLLLYSTVSLLQL